MAEHLNSKLLQLLYPRGGEPTLLLPNGDALTLSKLLDDVSLDQALEVLKVIHLQGLDNHLKLISSQLEGVAELIKTDQVRRG